MEENTENSQSILDTLYSTVFDWDDLPELEQAQKEITEHDLKSEELCKWADDQVRELKGKKLLAQARVKRLEQEVTLQQIEERSSTNSIEKTKKWLREKLTQLANNEPSQAQVFCRRFEEATDEDLFQLEAEIRMLESTSDNEAE